MGILSGANVVSMPVQAVARLHDTDMVRFSSRTTYIFTVCLVIVSKLIVNNLQRTASELIVNPSRQSQTEKSTSHQQEKTMRYEKPVILDLSRKAHGGKKELIDH